MTLPTKPQTSEGIPPRRARVLLGATQKVGKTTLLANWAPQTTLIVDTQNGTLLLEGEHYVQHVTDWPGFVRLVDDVCRGGHPFHTIGLDLVNDLWRFCDLYHGKRDHDGTPVPATGLDDYGRSRTKAVSAFNLQVGRLLNAPVGIWFLTHLREKTDKKGELVVYVPDIDKNVYGFVAGAVDYLWLAEVVNGRRIVHTQPTSHFEAGSRRALPSPLPMDAGEIARALDKALNPQKYAQPAPPVEDEPQAELVPPAEVVEQPQAPPEVKDFKRVEGESDIQSEDPWWLETEPQLKGIPGSELRKALVGIGVTVPDKVSSWQRLLCSLNADKRVLFTDWLLSRGEPVPWGEDEAVAALEAMATEKQPA